MDQPKPASIREVPTRKFALSTLLSMIFSNHDVGNYLVSRDVLPPPIPSALACNSISINSMMIPHGNMEAFLLTSVERADDEDERKYGVSEDKANAIMSGMIPPKGEDCFYILHSNSEDYAFLTVVDHRTPIAFLEKSAKPVSGLRRVVQMKLTKFGFPNTHLAVVYFWLTDGNSSMIVVVHDTENGYYYTEKNFILLKPYPESRFPKFSDVLESMLAFEDFFCPWCTSRGYKSCECAYEMLDRQKTPIPPKHMRDGRSLHQWTCRFLESGLRKYIVQLENYPKKVCFSSITFHQLLAFVAGQESYQRALNEYMQALRPFVENQLGFKNRLALPEWHSDSRLGKKNGQGVKRSAASGVADPTSSFDKHKRVKAWNMGSIANEPSRVPSSSILEPNSKPGLDTSSKAKQAPILPISSLAGPSNIGVDEAPSPDIADAASAIAYLQELDQATLPSTERKACRFCDGSFARTHDLKRHIQSKHLSVRAFTCADCRLEFTRRSHLELHAKSKHQNIQHTCPYCQQTFSYAAACRRHIKAKHPADISTVPRIE